MEVCCRAYSYEGPGPHVSSRLLKSINNRNYHDVKLSSYPRY